MVCLIGFDPGGELIVVVFLLVFDLGAQLRVIVFLLGFDPGAKLKVMVFRIGFDFIWSPHESCGSFFFRFRPWGPIQSYALSKR